MVRVSFMKDVVPLIGMILVEFVEIGMSTLVKAAMNQGLSRFVFIVYYNALGSLLLFPFYLYNHFRGTRVPMTFSLLYKFFLLGLIGICLIQICAFTGISYSSPTLAAAIGNIIPVFTFVLAVILRMEKLDIRSPSSQAKCIGTIIAITGAMVATLYKGPTLISQRPTVAYYNMFAPSNNWALGGLFLLITCLLSTSLNLLQTAAAKECPDGTVLVFFYSLFGTLLSAVATLFIEKDPNAWKLHNKIEIISIIFSAVATTIFRSTVMTWCLREKGVVYVVSYKPLSIVIAVIMGLVFLKDNLYLGSVIGSVAIVSGFYAVIWGQTREKNSAANDSEFIRDQRAPLLENIDDPEVARPCGLRQ
ncbi:hypothetical protein vseg_002816 [Gypsophila vaccaria]